MKKMKIFSIAIMVAVLCLCTMQIAFAKAVTPEGYYQVDGMTYKLDTATNTASTYIYGTYVKDSETAAETWIYTLTDVTIVVPATITVPDGQYAGTYNVTKIGEYTFGAPSGKARGQSETTENETTTSITLPEGITGIGKYAFNGFKEMSALVIPSTVTTIEAYAFTGSSGLKTIDLKNTAITAIPDRCFNNCYNLSKLELPSTVNSIHMNAFINARSLVEVKINSEEVEFTEASSTYGFPAAFGISPNSIATNGTGIVPTIFYVKTDTIKNRLKELAAKDVVSSNKKYDLSGIRYGSQIKLFFDPITIDNVIYSQYNDAATEAIITGNTIEKLSQLNLVIPSKITVSGREITVKAVGAQAFCYLDADGKPAQNGKTIKSIILPETVTSIGKQAFYRQNDIIKFVAKGDIELNDDNTAIFSGCSQITEVDFKSINKLTDKMFDYCLRLESIVIPTGSSITIDKTAFDRCANSTNVSRFDVYLNAGTVTFAGDDDKETMKLENSIMYFHVPTESAKATLSEYGISDANVIVGKKLYLLDNSLGTYAVASEAMPEGKIIVATYKGDELVNVDEIKDVDFGVGYNAIETSLEVSRGITRKIFVWSDLTSMIPLGAMIN